MNTKLVHRMRSSVAQFVNRMLNPTSSGASKDSSTSSSSSEDELTAAFKKVSIEPKDDIVVEEKAKEKKHDEPKASEAIITRPIIKSILGRERIQKLADYIRSDECKNIIFMTGAGISTCKLLDVVDGNTLLT